MFNFAERRFLFFMFSAAIIIPGLIAMGYLTATEGSPVKLSIDFTGGTLLEIPFESSDIGEQDVRDAIEAYGFNDYVVQQLDPQGAVGDLANSRYEIVLTDSDTDIAALNTALQENVGAFWSPDDEKDDPNRTTAEKVERITSYETHIDISFVNDVSEDDLNAALAAFGLTDATVQALDPLEAADNPALSRYEITIPTSAAEIDVDALNTALQAADGVGEFWSMESAEVDPDRTAAQLVEEVETGSDTATLIIDVSFVDDVSQTDLEAALADFGANIASITPVPTEPGTRWQIRLEELDPDNEQDLKEFLQQPDQLGPIWTPNPNNLDSALLSSHVSATVGREVTQSAVVATAVVAVVVLAFIVFAFRKVEKSFRYGACAIIAMFHDILVTMGIMAIMGIFFGWEVDALFLTAILTVVGFSVQDSIVVFDRIRENLPKYRGEQYETVVNRSVLETIHRSLATQLNAIFVMFAILLFGGETIKQFIGIMLIGLMSGTYSSIFNAVPLLVAWEKGEIPFVNQEAKRKRQQQREEELASANS